MKSIPIVTSSWITVTGILTRSSMGRSSSLSSDPKDHENSDDGPITDHDMNKEGKLTLINQKILTVDDDISQRTSCGRMPSWDLPDC